MKAGQNKIPPKKPEFDQEKPACGSHTAGTLVERGSPSCVLLAEMHTVVPVVAEFRLAVRCCCLEKISSGPAWGCPPLRVD